ncbi:diguanylate cyclase (GGDEF) domain-containing protein [Actinokineospora alba]|uniref:Diguanylate cyclase (GGDEF) domain-containing protein n=2 Tax=Actinokineospora alba TaxID=504798 RepID=A0A1H0WEJ2_9PSEU|nr:diguanylate cyclase (GGDEF)-like protein [Actinokineospora alba]SDI75492.1 diguanylate cyclase (GGDEF) domain-containing protein [Actinokineospora alba]SDP89150.1 diguanylate cyclase (GGDEF) domain-containing protein [Actinokineospora alba]
MTPVTMVQDVSFAFQPLLSTRTGEPVAVEALARPKSGGIYDLLRKAGKSGRLVETDITLASRAVLAAARHDVAVPLHVNILAATATKAEELIAALRPALKETGRHQTEVVLEISPPFSQVHRAELLRGLDQLRELGYRIAFDSVGDGDLPLSLLADVAPDLVKLDAHLIGGLPDEPASLAIVESLAHFCSRTGIRLAAVGVDSEDQLLCLNRLGVRLAQGALLAGETADATTLVPLPRQVADIIELNATTRTTNEAPGVPMVVDFLRPATTLPETVTAEEVRDALAAAPTINGVILVDNYGRPTYSVERSRFLIAVTGPYGHALNAKKPASRHADAPRVIRADATGLQLLEMVGDADWERAGDDIVVVDNHRVCLGVVRLTEVVRGVAESKIEQAAALNPVTRLPGAEIVDREIDRRIHNNEMFVVAWLDVDSFKAVNDTVGFAAGDDLIRSIGRALADAEADLPGTRVSHVGGDDFLIVTELDEIATLAGRVVDQTWVTEGMTVTVSLASLVCGVRTVASYREASRLLAPLKKQAKAVAGSSWVLTRPGADRVEVLRGRPGERRGQHALRVDPRADTRYLAAHQAV